MFGDWCGPKFSRSVVRHSAFLTDFGVFHQHFRDFSLHEAARSHPSDVRQESAAEFERTNDNDFSNSETR